MYVIAIPSYNRPNTIATKTLKLLHDNDISANIITIFVANEAEADVYRATVPKDLYGEIVIGCLGIANQRNFIRNHYAEGMHVVSLDDDITSIDILTGSTCTPIANLDSWFRQAFDRLVSENLYLWGVYPVRNPFYMQDKQTTDLRFIIGVCHGYINRHLAQLVTNPLAESKEDYEQTILHFLNDGGVLRYNNVACKTRFNAPGGLGTDRHDRNQMASDYLCKTYPSIVTPYIRKNGTPEVRMKRLARKLAPTRSIKQIHARKCFTNAEMKTREKTYLTEADSVDLQFITDDCDVIDEDTGAILAHFRCNAVEDIDDMFYSNVIQFARTANTYKKKGERIMTNMVGYMDGYQPKQLYMFAMNNMPPPLPAVRACRFTVDYPDKYEKMSLFFRQIDGHYNRVAQHVYKLQSSLASETPFTIADTAFSTCTVNVNYQTPIHKDSGDIEGCYGVLTVLGNNNYTGGQTCLPQYNIGFDVRKGCVLTMNVHEWHCNLPIENTNIEEPAERLAVVCYLREGVYSKTRGLTAEFRDQHLSLLKNIRK